jgi:PAS domain-containing protein
MNRIENLSLRTTKALSRLTALQRRAEATRVTPSVVRDALDELTATLEALRAANETLADQATQMAAARHQYADLRRDYFTIFTAMPVACVLTDGAGSILDANPEAARLLNVGGQHLTGKPLLLFFTDRDLFIQTLGSSSHTDFEHLIVVRPRERKPRQMLVRGTRMGDCERWCWLLIPPPQVVESAPVE